MGLPFGLLGQIAVYARQRKAVGTLGFAGFLLGSIGNGLTVGAAFLNALTIPVLAVGAPELTGPTGPPFAGPLGIVVLLGSLMVTVGFGLFGIAIVRAAIFPRVPAVLMVCGCWFGLAAIFSPAVFDIAGIVFGLANGWLGYWLWGTLP